MLSYEISYLSSNTSVNKVICPKRNQFFGHMVSSWAHSSFIKRTFEVKLYRIAAEELQF